jgi:hypothetical protein
LYDSVIFLFPWSGNWFFLRNFFISIHAQYHLSFLNLLHFPTCSQLRVNIVDR